jgi:type II secretory pathway component PulF
MEFDVLEGSSFETAIKKSMLFDEGELLRISLAERSSNLSFVLNKIYEKAAAKQRQEFEMFLRLMGPAAILFLGIIVFLVAFVIISPMMTIQQGLS